MTEKVKILEQTVNNKKLYAVQAVLIHKNNSVLLIPSPFGTEVMTFDDLDNAINQIEQLGYEYLIVKNEPKNIKYNHKNNYKNNEINYEKIADVFIKNLGHENLEIRNSAINSLSKLGDDIFYKLVEIINTERNWLVLQSVIKCIEKIVAKNKNSASFFLEHLIKISETDNTMVRSAALKALEKICDYKAEE